MVIEGMDLVDDKLYTDISINLVIISKISKGERIYRGDDNLIVVSHGGWLEALFRTISGYNRLGSVGLVYEKIGTAFSYSRQLMNGDDPIPEPQERTTQGKKRLPSTDSTTLESDRLYKLNELGKKISQCTQGINAMRATYTDDINICARLEHLADECSKVSAQIKEHLKDNGFKFQEDESVF